MQNKTLEELEVELTILEKELELNNDAKILASALTYRKNQEIIHVSSVVT